MSSKRTTWGYARLSVDLGQIGLEAQTAEVKRYAQSKGWTIKPEHMISETVPAYKRGKTPVRQGFSRLLETAEADPQSFRLVIYNLDRLVRDLSDWVRLRAVADRGAEVHAVTGNLDLSTGVGRMQAGVVTSVKEFEVEELTRRIRAQKAYRKGQGEFLGSGRRSFGYSDKSAKRQIVPAEADLLREALRRAIDGESWRSIAAEWNAKGIPTPNSKTWTANNLSKMFESPVLYGEIHYHEDEGTRVVRAPWEPILTDEDRRTVQELRQERRTYKGNPALKHPLSGLLMCGKCGERRMVSNGVRKYLCKNCLNAIHKQHTENLVEKMCLLRLRDWQPKPETEIAGLDLSKEQEELAQFERMRAAGLITPAMFQLGAREVQERIDAKTRRHRTQIKEIPAWMKDGDTILQTWEELTPKQKREVMSRVFESVTILPYDRTQGQGAFQPERIQIQYR